MASEIETGREAELQRARIAELEARVSELGRRLLEADARLSQIAELEVRVRELMITASEFEAQRDDARATLQRARDVHAAMVASVSWRVTAPLRVLFGSHRRPR